MTPEARDNLFRTAKIAVIVMAIGSVFLIPFWWTFGPAIQHSIEHPETTVESRSDIDRLPSHVERLAGPTLSDEDLEYLAQRVAVTELDLGDNSIVTDEGMRHVARIRGLNHLSLYRTNVTDAGIRHLRKTPLEYINLWETQIGDKSLGYIAEMGSMKQLQIKNCSRVTDAGVAKLAPLEDLWMVNLSGCTRITDKSIHTLTDMPSVSFIQVFDCPKLTDGAIDEFLAAFPNREVHR